MKKGMVTLIRICVFAALFITVQLQAQPYAGITPEQDFSGASATGVFIENGGQVYDGRGNFRSDVDFVTSSAGTNIYFTDHGIVYHFFKIEPSKYDLIRSKKIENPYTPQEWEQINKDISEGKMDMDLVETRGKQYRIDIEFPGADLSRPKGEKPAGMKRNYFHPKYNDGIYGVSSYEQIRYSEAYPGIDLIFYFRNGQLKYDFELAPGADPTMIRILYKGHQNIKLDAEGNAVVSILPGEIVEQAPVAFQDGKQVAAGFKLSGDTLLFETGEYNSELPLTIDPALRWSTWFYDNSTSAAFTYARPQWDTNGNMFMLMDTYATAFPTVNPGGTAYYDFSAGDNGLQMVIMKFDPYRNLVWATYYCSSQSLATNFCNQGLVIDQNNEIYCVGHMFFVYGSPAAAFPTLIPGGAYSETTPGNNRNCILKFANNGTLIWSTVFCTSNPASSSGLDLTGLAIDGSNRLVAVGESYTPPSWTSMPVLNPGGSTYYNAAPAESATPTLHRFTTGLALQYSTYVSRGVASQYFNYGSCIAIDGSNNIFMGNSGTGNITTANPGGAYIDGTGGSERKIILYKFLSSGALSWCTLYGGTSSANGIIWQDVRDVDIASNGDVVFVGRVNTTNFPTYNPGSGAFYKSTLSIGSTSVCDGVILKFSNTGARLWATYIGGDGTSDGTDLMGMGIDENDKVYTSGICRSTSFPTQTLAGSYNQSTMTGSVAIIINMFNSSCVRQWGTYFGTGTYMMSGGFGVNNWVCDGVKLMQFGSAPSATPITTLDPGNGAYFHSTIEGTTCDFFAEFFYGTETTADATITAVTPVCINATAFNLSAATSGGTWSGTGITNATNGTFNPATAGVGTHTITYSISGICGDTDTETITVNALPSVTASVTDASICDGESTTISASGGTTYNWSHSLGSGSSYAVNPSSTTTYTVTGTSSGCTNTATITVNVTAKPSVTASATIPTICNGASTTISATGGTTYNWSHSLGSNSAYSVSPSATTTYTVTGTSSGCTNTNTVTVTVNAVPDVSASASSPTICNGNSTTVSASGATSYSWSPSGSGASFSASPSSTTTYTVTGTSSGCTDVATVTVTVNAVPDVSASASTPTICNGNSTTVSASGATSYSWSPSGSGASFSASPSSTTTYTVTGTSSGCTDVATVTVTVNAVPDVSASASTPTICNGNSTTVSASGATSYSWSPSGSGASFSASPSSTTTYTVTGTSSGCTDVATVTVTVNAVPDVSASASSPTICNGSSTLVSASGATSYSWSPSGSGSSFSASPSSTTTYTVTGTSSGCTDVATVTVTVNEAPSIGASASIPTICEGGSTTISATGGTTYNWSHSLGSNASYSVNPSTTTTYTVTGTTSGCTNIATITVNVNSLPNITTSVTDATICNGESTTISAMGGTTYNWSGLGTNNSYSVNPSATTTYSVTGTAGGCSNTATIMVTVNATPNITASATYPSLCIGESTDINAGGGSTYTWDNALGAGTTHNVTPAATTTYNVTGTDANGCTSTAQVTVSITTAPAVTAIAGNSSLCQGSSTTLNGGGAVSYTWDQGLGAGGSFIISPTSTTTYHVTGSSATGCSATADVTVTVNPVPADPTAAGTPSQICLGESTDITASGSGSVDYEVYSAPTGGTYLGDASLTVTPTTTTVYYVQAVNSYGCANTGGRVPVTIIVNPLPVQPSVSASDTTICAGQSVALLAGGSGSGVVYEVWTAASGGTNLGYAPMMVNPSATTTYYVQAVTAAGCTPAGGRVGFTFTVNPVTDAAMNPAGPFCISDAATTLTAVNAGGTWAGTGITNTANGTFDPATAGAGTHQILYTTSGVCQDTDTMNVVVTNLLDATIIPAGPFCLSDGAVNLTAATAGGTWSGTGITNTTSGTFDPATAGIGVHEIVYSTSGSCADSDTIQITVSDQMDASITAVGPFCETEAGLVLTAADAGGTWSGTGILNAASGLFDPATAGPGTHQIKYIIPGSCGDADSINIVVYDSPDFNYVATDESCTGAEDGSIVLTVTGGVNPITYTWNTGANTPSVAGIGEGSYTVTVSDANGCERNAAITLGDPGVACDDIHPHAVVPNAFSPNADGENDVLYVRGEGVSQLTFIVYDRWGEKVFSTTSLDNGWDGTFRGKELDPAVFTYYLQAIFVDGTDKIEKGDITLTR